MTTARGAPPGEADAASLRSPSAMESDDSASGGGWIRRLWQLLGLPGQFLIATGLTLVFFAIVDEHLQARTLEYALRQNSAETASIYISGIIAPLIPVPVDIMKPGSASHERLDRAIADAGLRKVIERIKIWRPDGTIIYSTVPELVGRTFSIEELKRTVRGEIVFGMSDPDRAQDHLGAETHKPMLEVHVPIRDANGAVIAVGEFHKDSSALEARQASVVKYMWLFRGLSLLLGGATLFYLVKRAHTTITTQERQLRRQYNDASHLAKQNETLRTTADELRRKAVQSNEELLSRVGAEIHDGPVQLLSIAMIALGASGRAAPASATTRAVKPPQPEKLVSDVIEQLRDISTGLILPELEDLLPGEVILLAIAQHERITGSKVEANVAEIPAGVSSSLKACMYRIVQECMNNSSRHANGRGLKVVALHDDQTITLTISDEGPGPSSTPQDDRPRLGLLGARNRVEAFGGTISVKGGERAGMIITAVIPIDGGDHLSSDPMASASHLEDVS